MPSGSAWAIRPQVLVETFETGEHITKYVEMGPGAPHNAELAALGSGAMLQVHVGTTFPSCWTIFNRTVIFTVAASMHACQEQTDC